MAALQWETEPDSGASPEERTHAALRRTLGLDIAPEGGVVVPLITRAPIADRAQWVVTPPPVEG